MVRLTRQFHWEHRLVTWAESVAGMPYVWGETDCVSLAIAALGEITRRSREALGFPRYHTKFGAIKVMVTERRRHGSLADAFTERGVQCLCVLHREPARYLQSGDLVLFEDTGHGLPEMNVIVGSHVLVAEPTRGVYLEPLGDLHHNATDCHVLRVP